MESTPTVEFQIFEEGAHRSGVVGVQPKAAANDVVDGLLRATATLPGSWIISLHGGEPAAHPRVLELALEVAEQGHGLALQTRLTARQRRYEELFEVAGDTLTGVTAYLKLDEVVSLSAFMKKLLALERRLPDGATLQVVALLHEETFRGLLRAEKLVAETGIPFRYMLPLERGELARYSPEVEHHIVGKVLGDADVLRDKPMRGRLCHAGELYFRVTCGGEVFRCRALEPAFRLGSVKDGTIARFAQPKPCTGGRCTAYEAAVAGMLRDNERGSLVDILRSEATGVIDTLLPLPGRALGLLLRHKN